jgi:hypothetical protein
VVHQAAATGEAASGSDVGQVARYTTGQVAPERIDDLVCHVREHNAPHMQQQRGFVRTYYCTDRQGGRVMVGSLWQSHEALQQAEATLNQAREQAGQAAGAQSAMSSEVYEVVL